MRKPLAYLLICFCLETSAQQGTLYFRNLNIGNGLSHNKVNCVLQDKRGFMWLGTDDGLNRYDGYRFEIFRHDPTQPSSISGNMITDMVEDSAGILWIATADGGLTRYDYRLPPATQFKQYKHSAADPASIPLNIINALIEDNLGNLWLATSGHGVLRFNKQTEEFTEPIRRRSRTYLDLAVGPDGRIWAGRQGGGLVKIDPYNMDMEEDPRYNDVYAGLPHMTVASIYKDRQNNMWMGSWDKVIYRIRPNQKEEVFANTGGPFCFPGDDPLAFAEDKHGLIWIGGQYHGLYSFNPATQQFINYRHNPAIEGSLADNRINCIYIDRAGIIWIGTNRGVSVYNPAQQKFAQHFLPVSDPGHVIYDFIRSNENELWIGTSSGLYRLKDAGSDPVHIPLKYRGEQFAISKFFRDDRDEIYIGTNLTLFKLLPGFKLSPLPNTDKDVVMKRIIESRVVSMITDTIDSHPVLLISPYGHYFTYYDFTEQKWVSRQDSVRQIIKNFNIRDNLIRKFYKTSDGRIWIATNKFGLGEWVNQSMPVIKYYYNIPGDKTSIGNNNIFDMIEDAKGNLWISTYGGGLHYFNTKTKQFTHITASHNLAEGLQLDESGNVWMIANGNLHKYDPYHRSYTSYQLPDLEKSGGVKGYIFKDRDGKLYVAGSNYYIAFSPSAIREVQEQPRVHLTDFRIFNNSYSHLLSQKEIVLKYNQHSFSLAYAAPAYQDGYPVQYAHKLEGVDAEWVLDGTRNTINYTNLDHGEYIFKVRATKIPGSWGPEFTTIRIRVQPPFWKAWWFYLLAATLVTLLVFAVYRYRINELLKRQAIRNKIAQDLHDNVGSTLSSISVYSQVAKIYKEQNRMDQLQETIEKISTTSSEMISEMNDIVWAINPRNDNMATILQRMESFARPLLASQDIRFHFSYEMSVQHLHLEMNKRKNFYLIFKEAVNNAIKYSGCQNIWVEIWVHHHQLRLIVRDDGKGFDTQKARSTASLSGNGVQNMQMRAREMKGQCKIQSEPGKGTIVTLNFPIP